MILAEYQMLAGIAVRRPLPVHGRTISLVVAIRIWQREKLVLKKHLSG